MRLVIVGDFNIPTYVPTVSDNNISHVDDHPVLRFASEHNLTQLAKSPSRSHAFLDLIFVSPHYVDSVVIEHAPIAGSDHNSQLLQLHGLPPSTNVGYKTTVDYNTLNQMLSQVSWDSMFAHCTTVDDYAICLDSVLKDAVAKCTTVRHRTKRRRLPRHIVMLLRAKRRAWKQGKTTGQLDSYYALRRTTRAAIRQYRHNQESHLVYSANRQPFFNYVYHRLGSSKHHVQVTVNGDTASDSVAAEAFSREFTANFSTAAAQPAAIDEISQLPSTLSQFNCTEGDIIAALKSCSSSNSSPDGISYRIIKSVARYILYPLKVISQHSFHDSVFPSIWKQAVVIPVYKGRDDRAAVQSYRPISLCNCLSKVLKKIVCSQLTSYLSVNNLLHGSQHGFVAGKSTLTNLLTTDRLIADAVAAGHPYDIVSFDFRKAFDKAPHHRIIESAFRMGICGQALSWLSDFLSSRSQRVRIGSSYSSPTAVTSGLVQGSCLGPILFTILLDTLLRRLRHSSVAFADDLKYVADVAISSRDDVQEDATTVENWSAEYGMPVSIEKSLVLHCGLHQPKYVYSFQSQVLRSADNLADLGVQRSSDGGYSVHCAYVVNKASKVSGAIRRVFRFSSQKLLWPAFLTYVLPILTYCSPAWNTNVAGNIKLIESVQRRFTKRISELKHLPYSARLHQLGDLTVQNRLLFNDMVCMHRCVHGQLDGSQLGITTVISNTRNNGIAVLQRRARSKTNAALFSVRAPSAWNKMPHHVTNIRSLPAFKKALFMHLLNVQF